MTMQQQTPVVAQLADLERAGWTVRAIADRLGINPHTISCWRAGRQAPVYPELVRAALETLARQPAPPAGKRGPKFKLRVPGRAM